MFDEAARREINEGKEISLVPGLVRLRNEVLDRLRPDTIVIIDSHWETTVEHVLAAQARRHGIFTSSELPRGMAQIPYDFPGDPELAKLAAALGQELGTRGRPPSRLLRHDQPPPLSPGGRERGVGVAGADG
jgi:aromatic ring-opening dioxygenase catalytic subunit (LigB family)